jgi:hypothetical protein
LGFFQCPNGIFARWNSDGPLKQELRVGTVGNDLSPLPDNEAGHGRAAAIRFDEQENVGLSPEILGKQRRIFSGDGKIRARVTSVEAHD